MRLPCRGRISHVGHGGGRITNRRVNVLCVKTSGCARSVSFPPDTSRHVSVLLRCVPSRGPLVILDNACHRRSQARVATAAEPRRCPAPNQQVGICELTGTPIRFDFSVWPVSGSCQPAARWRRRGDSPSGFLGPANRHAAPFHGVDFSSVLGASYTTPCRYAFIRTPACYADGCGVHLPSVLC